MGLPAMKERVIAAAVVVLLIAALVVVVVADRRRIRNLQHQVAELSEKVEASDALPTMEQQTACDKDAKAFFNEANYKGYLGAEYYSHYNAAMKKCFVNTRTSEMISGQLWTTNELYDAIEHKNYATYRWRSDKVKKYWEVPPVECSVETSKDGPKTCNSDVEFVQLAREYMDVSD